MPIIDGRLYVDNTIEKTVALCDLQCFLRHVHDYVSPEEQAILDSGTAGHESQARFFKGLAVGESHEQASAYAMQQLAYEYGRMKSLQNVPYDDRLHYNNVRDIYAEWYRTRGRPGSLGFTFDDPAKVEVGFAVPLDSMGEYVQFGRFDGLPRWDSSGEYLVEELKNTGRITDRWLKRWRLDSQPIGYFWAAREHFKVFGLDVKGAVISAIELSKLPSGDTKCTRGKDPHGVPYDECRHLHMKSNVIGPLYYTDQQIEHWKMTAIRLAERYARLLQLAEYDLAEVIHEISSQGQFNQPAACNWCDFHDVCDAGRHAGMLAAAYIKEKWMPFDPSGQQISPSTPAQARQEPPWSQIQELEPGQKCYARGMPHIQFEVIEQCGGCTTHVRVLGTGSSRQEHVAPAMEVVATS